MGIIRLGTMVPGKSVLIMKVKEGSLELNFGHMKVMGSGLVLMVSIHSKINLF